MEEQIDIVSSIGSHGIACLGLATEVQKLSFKEKKIIIEMIAKKLNGIIPFAVTIQGNSLKEQIDLINIASANQANWIILQPYLKTKKISENDCLNYYKKLSFLTSLFSKISFLKNIYTKYPWMFLKE